MSVVGWRATAAAVALLGALALGGGCGDPGYTVRVHLPGDPADATRIELSLLRSCDGVTEPGAPAVTVIRSVEIRGEPADLGAAEPGSYGLYGRAWRSGCQLYAAGCAPITVEADGEGALDVFLVAVPTRSCAGGEQCIDERCAPPGICFAAGESCSTSDSCCSGVCDLGTCATGDCTPEGFSCFGSGSCCAGATCFFGFCLGPDGGCAQPLDPCEVDENCCSGACQAGLCSTGAGACKQAEEMCVLDEDCCSDSCVSGHCLALPGCTVMGERCNDDSECCSGDCSSGGCRRAEDCRPAGEICPEGTSVCCSGRCDGTPPRCAIPVGCLPYGELCSDDRQCCSDCCFADRCD